MIEFGTKRSGGGKKSRLHKKFPRKKIDKVGEKVAGWFRSNWDDDSYPYFSGNLRKFLLSNVGRPVDKVFSEFLGRCRTSAKRYNLRHEFYSMFEEKEDITEVINTTLYNYVRNAFRIQLNNYTTDELVSKREEFEKAIEERLSKELLAENFQLEQMTSGLQYPQTLVNAIDAKNAAVQEAQKAQNEVLKIKAEAEKKIAAADGEAQALKIKGDAEAEYNRKIAASLSPLIVQQMMLDKWDGKLPVYGTVPTLFKDIAGK